MKDTLKQNEEKVAELKLEKPQLDEKIKSLKDNFYNAQKKVFVVLPELLESKQKETELYSQFYLGYLPDEEKLQSFVSCVRIVNSL